MATNLKLIPRAERLLEGKITADMTDSQTTVTVDNPPLITALPSYLEIDPDSATYRELCRVIAVSSSTITLERGLNNGGTGFPHSNNTAYKFKFTSRHWEAVATALESGYLTEDSSYVFTQVSSSSFKITASTVDRTDLYTEGRKVRLNGSVIAKIISSSYSNPDTTIVVTGTSVPAVITTVELAIDTKGETNDKVDKTSDQTISGEKTFESGKLISTSPKITTSINDSNGNEIIKTPATTSAVNEVTITNGATNNAPTVSATGDDTNIDLSLKGKGTGTVKKPSSVSIQVFDGATDIETGDGKAYISIPEECNGMNLVGVYARVVTAGTTGTTDIQLRNVTDSQDMLSTKLTIDSGETGSDTAATAAVINTSYDDVATNDLIAVDVDAKSTTPPKGLIIRLRFALP